MISASGPAETRRDAYEIDGFVVVRGVLDADLVAEMGAHVDWLQARHPELRAEDLGHALIADDPFWLRVVGDDRLVDLAEVFIGPDIALFASHYICKPPHSGRPVLWHQDAGYWPLDPMEVVTLWVAVDPSTSENGCLRVVPGSHRHGIHAMRDRHDVASVFGSETAVSVDELSAVDVVLDAGDVEVHHPNLLHSSGSNTSASRRCGLTIRYIPTSTRIVTEQQPYASAFHVRGAPGVNSYQPYPSYVPSRHFPFASRPGHHDSCSGATRASTTRSTNATAP